MTFQRNRFTDPAEVELALIAGRLQAAAEREDIVQTLISTADLDHMVRSLGPQHEAVVRHAQSVVARAITVLEQAVARGEVAARRDGQLRAAYNAPSGQATR